MENLQIQSSNINMIRLQGSHYRRSRFTDDVYNKRYGILFVDGYVTYKTKMTPNGLTVKSGQPSRSWKLKSNCIVSKVYVQSDAIVRQKTQMQTLQKMVQRDYQNLHCFSIKWPGIYHTDKLVLGFENEEQAEKWQIAFSQTIKNLEQTPPLLMTSLSKRTFENTKSATDSPVAAARPQATISSIDESFLPTPKQVTVHPPPPASETSEYSSVGEPATSPGTVEPPLLLPMNSVSQDPDPASTLPDKWRQFKLTNGLVLYKESAEAGGGYMVSVVVRATPRQCCDALVDVKHNHTAISAFSSVRVEERNQENQLLHCTVDPPSFWRQWVHKRDMYLRLTASQDECGTYTVLLRSEDTPKTPGPERGTVRAHVDYMCYSCAPVRDMTGWGIGGTRGGGASTDTPMRRPFGRVDESRGAGLQAADAWPECLVTLVVKIDWKGQVGMVQDNAWGGPGGFWNFSSWPAEALSEQMLTCLVSLRDKVEQDRFQVSPITLFTQQNYENELAQHAQHSLHLETTPSTSTQITSDHSEPCVSCADRESSTLLTPQSPKSPPTDPPSPGPRTNPSTTILSDTPFHPRGPTHTKPKQSSEQEVFQDAYTKHDDGSFRSLPPQDPPGYLPDQYFSRPKGSIFKVRGPNYLADRQKQPSQPCLTSLAFLDLVTTPTPTEHISRFLPQVTQSTAPYLLVIVLSLPYQNQIYQLVLALACPYNPQNMPHTLLGAQENGGGTGGATDAPASEGVGADGRGLSPADVLLQRFVSGQGSAADAARDKKFKLIPSVVNGPWIVKQCVGQTPVMLGKKLKTTYYHGVNYMEADIDIGANATAAGITSMVAGYVSSLTLDIGILLEGQSSEELPERMLGCVRLEQLDMKAATPVDV